VAVLPYMYEDTAPTSSCISQMVETDSAGGVIRVVDGLRPVYINREATTSGHYVTNLRARVAARAMLPSVLAISALLGPLGDPGTSLAAGVRHVRTESASGENESKVDNSRYEDAHYGELSSPREDSQTGAPSFASSILEVKRRSGLTWNELASLFGVSRRALHNWAQGAQLNSLNAQRLADILEIIRGMDQGDERDTRAYMLSPSEYGRSPYEELLARRLASEYVDVPFTANERMSDVVAEHPRVGKLLSVEKFE